MSVKLSEAAPGQVLRNTHNGSYYRFERPENSGVRVRIWPLELFPNGRLISKPTPTIVEGDLVVEFVGTWAEDMSVDGTPSRSRRAYENELAREQIRLIVLQTEYEQLPTGGRGKLSRGSHANKVKNCRMRIEVLKHGLGFNDSEPVLTFPPSPIASAHQFKARQLVQLPSGLPAAILGFQTGGLVKVRTRLAGLRIESALPCEVLRPWSLARCCTV